MTKEWNIQKVDRRNFGVSVTKDGVFVRAVLCGKEKNGMLLYDENTVSRLDFPEDCCIGNVYQCLLKDLDITGKTYLFHEDGKPIMDPYAKAVVGHCLFGAKHAEASDDKVTSCVFVKDDFDWKGDKKPNTSYENSIYYGIHVRGFTMDSSSGIKEAGTFAGVTRKIPYLKKLGITGIVLQPMYQFDECKNTKLNYWGYQSGLYFAPKNAYAYSDDSVSECKTMVKNLHKQDMEVLLQFYFDDKVSETEAVEILSYWEQSYHVDGFHIIGNNELARALAKNPYLSDTKIWCEGFEEDNSVSDICQEHIKKAVYNRGYMYDCRRFLKGDAGMVSSVIARHEENSFSHGTIKFMASYDGMRMMDMVSYNEKHNEENGENNQDGDSYNCSWNCGTEGETTKKSIRILRNKQLKNALVWLFTSQGTPFLFMGDEYGRSCLGNNNPYCHDDERNYMKWNLKKQQKDLLAYTIQMIEFRKKYDVFRQKKPLRMTDYLSCGYPDVSYHGMQPWKPQLENSSRQIGMLFCGAYSAEEFLQGKQLYMLTNMFWEPCEFALPKLQKGYAWKILLNTEQEMAETEKFTDTTEVILPPRSICIYIAETKPKEKKQKR